MTERSSLKKVSKTVSSSHHSYQGNSYDPPEPRHIEGPSNLTQEPKSKLLRIGQFLGSLRLELVAFLFIFSYIVPFITTTSLIMEKVCLTSFNYSDDICDNLENNTAIKTEVERLATNYQIAHTLIQAVPTAFLAFFAGPWSDQYGRRIPLSAAIIGMVLDAIGTTICATYLKSHVGYLLIPAVFTGITGGLVTSLMVLYSSTSDLASYHERTTKFVFLEIATGFAQPFAQLAGGWMFRAFRYTPVYLLSIAGMCTTLLCVRFLLPETRGVGNVDPWHVKLKAFFSCKTFGGSFAVVSRKRPNKGRRQIVLLMISSFFVIIPTSSSSQINFLYFHHQFNWDVTIFSSYTAMYYILTVVLIIFFLPLLRHCKIGDPALGIIGTVSFILKFIGYGLAYTTDVFHIASVSGLLSALAPLAVKSRISKLVSNDDLGKVFSLVAVNEMLLPIVASVLISQIFYAFLPIFPGMPYFVIAVFLTFPLSVFIWTSFLPVTEPDTCTESAGLEKESYSKTET